MKAIRSSILAPSDRCCVRVRPPGSPRRPRPRGRGGGDGSGGDRVRGHHVGRNRSGDHASRAGCHRVRQSPSTSGIVSRPAVRRCSPGSPPGRASWDRASREPDRSSPPVGRTSRRPGREDGDAIRRARSTACQESGHASDKPPIPRPSRPVPGGDPGREIRAGRARTFNGRSLSGGGPGREGGASGVSGSGPRRG